MGAAQLLKVHSLILHDAPDKPSSASIDDKWLSIAMLTAL